LRFGSVYVPGNFNYLGEKRDPGYWIATSKDCWMPEELNINKKYIAIVPLCADLGVLDRLGK
jgi:hypothetical protein